MQFPHYLSDVQLLDGTKSIGILLIDLSVRVIIIDYIDWHLSREIYIWGLCLGPND